MPRHSVQTDQPGRVGRLEHRLSVRRSELRGPRSVSGPGTILRVWADAKLIYLAPGASQAQSQIGTYSNWDPKQHYVAGDLVFIPGPGGTPSGVWECVFPNINQTPGPTSLYWTANTGVGPFDFNLTYNAGDLVFFFTQEYASIQPNNSGNHPDTSPDWWTPLNNYWKPPTIYIAGRKLRIRIR